MGEYPMSPHDEREQERLRDLFPELEIFRTWWGWLAYPRGVKVAQALFSEGLESKLLRITCEGDGVIVTGPHVGGVADKTSYLPVDGA